MIHPKVAVPTAVSAVVTVALAIAQVVSNSGHFPVLVPIASAVMTVLTALSGYLTPGPAPKVPGIVTDVLDLLQQLAAKLNGQEAHLEVAQATTHVLPPPLPPADNEPHVAGPLFPPKDDSPRHAAWRPVAVGNPDQVDDIDPRLGP